MEPQPFVTPGDQKPEEGDDQYKELVSAVLSNDKESVATLLREGVDYCNSLLQLADSPDVVQLLLHAGANPDSLQQCGHTALTLHVQRSSADSILQLLVQCSDTNIPDKNGFTPLHHAIKKSRVSAVKLLLNHGADPALANEHSGETPLHLAARRGAGAIVKILITAGVPLSPVKKTGETPLHLAAWSRDTASAFLLLRHGTNVLARSKSGSTALHWASERGDKDMIILLLVGGADPLQRDHFGLSSVMVAAKRCGEENVFSQYTRHCTAIPSLQYLARKAVLWKAPVYDLESLPGPLRDYLTATDYQLMKSNMM